MSDIFREVDEALQQERLAKFWKEYGSTAIAAAIVLVLSTAATTGWKSWDNRRDSQETARLVEALESDDAAPLLEKLAGDTRDSHEQIALLTAAGLRDEKQEPEQALALYKQAYETGGDLGALARILYVREAMAQKEPPEAAALLEVLEPLLKDDASPWIWHARLDAATIAAHNGKDYKGAAAYLEPFEEAKGLPASLSQRGQALLQLYTLEAARTDKTETKEEVQG